MPPLGLRLGRANLFNPDSSRNNGQEVVDVDLKTPVTMIANHCPAKEDADTSLHMFQIP